MSELELSEEQLAAVRSGKSRLVVSAAAGSGKTRVLVERYLWHVGQGLSPDQILAITFTRKAAAEMKRRIVDRLSETGRPEQARLAETGPIQTIHGFCERMLRENAIDAGLDPEFEILSESQAERMLEESIEEILAYPPEDSEEAAALIRKLAGRRAYGESVSPHARLEAALRDAIYGWRGTGVSRNYLREVHVNPVALLAKWRESLLEQTPPDVVAAYHADSSGGQLGSKLISAYKSVKKNKPRYLRPSSDTDVASARDTCGLMQLACEGWARYEAKMRENQELDFIALEERTVALLTRSESAAERVRRQYPAVLVDEAQDLNPVQYALLAALRPEVEMFVGDRQQSIYGFRQADVKLFAQKESAEGAQRLSRNYRSSDAVLGFVDRVFKALWNESYEPMLDRSLSAFPGIALWMQPQKDTESTAGLIREVVEDWKQSGHQAKDIAVLVRQSSYAIPLLQRLQAIGVQARVAGGTEQFFARLEVRDMANALEALTDPYDDFALAAILRSPFVELSLDTLVLLGRSKPIIESIRGFVPRLDLAPQVSQPSEDQARLSQFLSWFDPLSSYADRLSAAELIGELFAVSPYLVNLARREDSRQRLANVRKLLALAAQEAEIGPRVFAERVRQIQTIRHKEGDAPAGDQDADEVTIMTIHKSKGLEFPVVILPDTHKKLSRPMKDVEIDPALRLVTTKFDRTTSMFHDWLGSERQKREEEEEWRVMYVGLTRAKERICVVANQRGAGDRIADQLYKLLDVGRLPEDALVRR